MPIFTRVSLALLQGFGVTLKIFTLTLVLAIPLGLILSFGSMTKFKPLKGLVRTFIWIIRGTPLMLQLIIIFYGPGLIGAWGTAHLMDGGFMGYAAQLVHNWHNFDRFIAVTVAFVINYSCYFSEIFRGGIEAIPKGQYEAGQVLGLKKAQVFFRIVLLQVIKHIVPPMSNEIMTLVKDTSLARMISVYEIIWAGQKFIKSDGLLWPLFYTGAYYLAFCAILTLLFGFIEKKLSYFK